MNNITFQHKWLLRLIVALSGICWVGLGWLLFRQNVGDNQEFWGGGRTVAYVLLLIAPALTFVPLGRALSLNFYGYWTVLSWAVFGFVLAFVPADPQNGSSPTLLPLTALLVSFFAVLVSVFMPLCYVIGLRFSSKRSTRIGKGYGRAWREAFMLAGFIVLMAFLRTIGGLSTLNALLIFLIVVVVELLFLARSR